MTPALIAAAVQLADTLAEENRALAALDLNRVAVMLDAKTRALEAFQAVQLLAARTGPGPGAGPGLGPVDQDADARELAAKLRDLADENRRLLEHAMAVQGRVIGMVARAAPAGPAPGSGRYGAGGGLARTVIRTAAAFSIGA